MDLFGGEEGATEDLAEAVQITGRRPRRRATGDAGVIVKDLTDVWVKLAKCCTPVPGDEILGFVTRGAGVSVHRADCTNAGELKSHPERLVEVEWAPTGQSMFLVNIQVEALDRARLLSDVTKVLSDMHVNILAASLNTGRDRVAKSRFTFEMADPKHLGHVLRAVRHVEGVFDAYRVTG
jgi:GTP pyrophosphokinase